MPALTIPPTTIKAGVTVLGPIATGAGIAGLEVILDVGNITALCTFLLEIAFDGVTWQDVAVWSVAAPPVDRHGVPVSPPNFDEPVDFGGTPSGPRLTTAESKARLTINNTTAFATAGGSLTPL